MRKLLILLLFASIVFLCFLHATHINEFFLALNQNQIEMLKLISAVTVGSFSIIIFFLTRNKELKIRSMDAKKKCYEEYLDNINDFFATNLFHPFEKDAAAKLFNLNYKILLYTSKKMNKAIVQLNKLTFLYAETEENLQKAEIRNLMMVSIGEIISLMRKDVGLSEDKINLLYSLGVIIEGHLSVYNIETNYSKLISNSRFLYKLRYNWDSMRRISKDFRDADKAIRDLQKELTLSQKEIDKCESIT